MVISQRVMDWVLERIENIDYRASGKAIMFSLLLAVSGANFVYAAEQKNSCPLPGAGKINVKSDEPELPKSSILEEEMTRRKNEISEKIDIFSKDLKKGINVLEYDSKRCEELIGELRQDVENLKNPNTRQFREEIREKNPVTVADRFESFLRGVKYLDEGKKAILSKLINGIYGIGNDLNSAFEYGVRKEGEYFPETVKRRKIPGKKHSPIHISPKKKSDIIVNNCY